MSLASLCYRVGWEPRGWTAGVPLLGVPTPARRALLLLAQSEGLPDGLDFLKPLQDAWPEKTRLPGPLDTAPLRQRMGAAILERVFPAPPQWAGETNLPWVWNVRGQQFDIDAHRLLHLESLGHLRKWARKHGLPHRPISGAAWERWTHLAPLAFRVWAMFWLGRLGRAVESGQASLKVRVHGDAPLPALALCDALALASAVNRLYASNWALPEVLLDAPGLSPASQAALAQMLGPCPGLDRPCLFPLPEADVVVGTLAQAGGEQGWFPASKVRAEADELEACLERRSFGFRPCSPDRPSLDHFFSRYYPYQALRDEQYASLRRLLAGESLLVLLPTGYGKSVIFQLAALVQPATALVVAPLRSLINDQLRGLREGGLRMAGQVGSGRAGVDELERGRLRLAYVTPERLQQANFRQAVERLAGLHFFSLVALDEAHCLSEWGHDFRPAFQHVRAFRRRLLRDQVEGLPIVALTATASRPVRSELLAALEVPPTGVIQSRSSDRPELSFSVHHAADGAVRAAVLNQVIRRPNPAGQGVSGQPGGKLVFVPFADVHASSTYRTSAPAVRDELAAGGLASQVGVSCSEQPRYCPHCGSARFWFDYGDSVCDACKRRFPNKKAWKPTKEEWDAKVARAQADFIAGRLPMLVATKGFGMGVDKPDIRVVAHLVMSGSLEGYYQEAGRAGRDGRHAHAALVVVPPKPECLRQHIREDTWRAMGPQDDIPLPCLRRNAKGFPSLKCDYGLNELCDFGQQASLIQTNFPGIDGEFRDFESALGCVRRGGPIQANELGEKAEQGLQKALTRLQQLGVIESFTKSADQFHADVVPPDPAAVIARLEVVLRSFVRGGRLLAEAARLRAMLPGSDPVPKAGRLLLEAVYTTVRGARLASLMNLHRYATLPAGACRRAYLQQHFDVASLGRRRPCGFCDGCVPGLDFRRDRALPPDETPRGQELALLITERVDEGDLEGLAEAATAGLNEGFGDDLRARSDRLLEERPGELAPLLLAALVNPASAAAVATRALALVEPTLEGVGKGLSMLDMLDVRHPGLAATVVLADDNPLSREETRTLLLEAVGQRWPSVATRLRRRMPVRDIAAAARLRAEALPAPLIEEFLNAVGGGT